MNKLHVFFQQFFYWVIETSLICSILVGFILVIKLIFRNKLPAKWHYILWLTLLFRLMLPPIPEGFLSLYQFLPQSSIPYVTSSSFPVQEMDMSVPVTDESVIPKSDASTEKIKVRQGDSLTNIAIYIWLSGVLGIGAVTTVVNIRIYFRMKRKSLITNTHIIHLFALSKKRLSIKRSIPLAESNHYSSPSVIGFIRPRILLSNQHMKIFSDEQLQFIFYHELAHIKRNDVLVNCFMNGVLILHWFNPVLWYAYFQMRQDQEIACDALALTYIDVEKKVEYGYTIIRLIDQNAKQYPISSAANMAGKKQAIKRRIRMIKQFQKASYRWSALGIAIILFITVVSLVNAKSPLKGKYDKAVVNTDQTISTSTEKLDANQNTAAYMAGLGTQYMNQENKKSKYIVLNDYYYMKTGETVAKDELGEQVAAVKRIGDWNIKKNGDSDEVPPGPIFAIQGKDPDSYIAAKGVIFENGQNKAAYLVFQKKEHINNTIEEQGILSAKNDDTEVNIAFRNIKKLLPSLYEYRDNEKIAKLISAGYVQRYGPGVTFTYRVPDFDTKEKQGYIFTMQYDKSLLPEDSEFSPKSIPVYNRENDGRITVTERKPISPPQLVQTFQVNDMNWGLYKNYYGQYVLKGEANQMIYELKFQGDFNPEDGERIARNFRHYD